MAKARVSSPQGVKRAPETETTTEDRAPKGAGKGKGESAKSLPTTTWL